MQDGRVYVRLAAPEPYGKKVVQLLRGIVGAYSGRPYDYFFFL